MEKDSKRNEELVLDDSIKVNNKGETILGVLEGPCADVINPTRNDRQYDEELWNNVFNDPIVREYFECGGILGELDHPADRTETDTSKVAICMPEKPKKGKDGKLYARFDILDTPNGRIVYTLAKYGYKLGVSSRGNGDVYEAFDGKEHVDPKTYELKAFDVVLLPAVKAARLSLKESVGNKSFKQAIKESLESATKDEKRIMVESLKKLKIDYKISQSINKQNNNNNNNVNLTESKISVNNNVADDDRTYLIEEIQKHIKENKELKNSLLSVQEQLSVCYAKEAKYEEEIQVLKESYKKLDDFDTLNSEISILTEQLADKEKQLQRTRERCSQLSEKLRDGNVTQKLNESLEIKDKKIQNLNEQLVKLQTSKDNAVQELKESLAEANKNSMIKQNEYSAKIEKAKAIIEKYKKISRDTLNKYLESKAEMLGLRTVDIRNKLSENFTFEDVDAICESMQEYQVALSKLPFELKSDKKVKVKVTESVEPIKPKSWVDDDVDDSLLRLAGL